MSVDMVIDDTCCMDPLCMSGNRTDCTGREEFRDVQPIPCDTCGQPVIHAPLLMMGGNEAHSWSALLCRACHVAMREHRLDLVVRRPDVQRIAVEQYGLPAELAAQFVA